MTDLVEGTGEPAKKGDTITVNYVGVRSEDGTEFDNSYDRGQPYTLTLGEGGVIAGLGRRADRRQGRRPSPARHPGRAGLRRPGRGRA